MSIIYATNAWPQFGVSLNKGLKKKKCNLYIAIIICQFDELSSSLTSLDCLLIDSEGFIQRMTYLRFSQSGLFGHEKNWQLTITEADFHMVLSRNK
jgi:hypothetical protein